MITYPTDKQTPLHLGSIFKFLSVAYTLGVYFLFWMTQTFNFWENEWNYYDLWMACHVSQVPYYTVWLATHLSCCLLEDFTSPGRLVWPPAWLDNPAMAHTDPLSLSCHTAYLHYCNCPFCGPYFPLYCARAETVSFPHTHDGAWHMHGIGQMFVEWMAEQMHTHCI